MLKPPLPDNELQRLEALRQLEILDTANESAYDKLVEMAATLCGSEMAMISLLDADRQWFKAATGITFKETTRDVSFCGHTIVEDEILIIADAHDDIRFADNPLVLDDPGIRFYAGVRLVDDSGCALGALCVADKVPRNLTEQQIQSLKLLAEHVQALMMMRKVNRLIAKHQAEMQAERQLMVELISHMMRSELLDTCAIDYWLLPAQDIAGDLICARRCPQGQYYVLLTDSAGHGLPSAINLLPVSQTFHSMVGKSLPLSLIIEELNKKIHDHSPINRFVAAIGLCFDARIKELEVWNGGMPDAVFIDADGAIQQRFKSTYLPLGVNETNVKMETVRYSWKGGGYLLSHSDGLVEATNANGEVFGEKTLESLYGVVPVGDNVNKIKAAVSRHLGGKLAHDDISVVQVSIERLP